MASVVLADLLHAYEFASAGGSYDSAAYVCIQTGTIYMTSSEFQVEEEVPADLETSERYLAIPSKVELQLGRNLAIRFTEQEHPASSGSVAEIFRKKGAYARYKQLLERHGLLQRWFEFEAAETEVALRRWCEENNLQVSARHEPPVA